MSKTLSIPVATQSQLHDCLGLGCPPKHFQILLDFFSSYFKLQTLHSNPARLRWGFPLRSRLSRFHDDLNMIAMIGTSDRLCWLAETCKILLLLLGGAKQQMASTSLHDLSRLTKLGTVDRCRLGYLRPLVFTD